VEAGLPEPLIQEQEDGIHLTFLKDVYTPEYLQTLGLNERQIKAILYMKEHGNITNAKYQALFSVSKPTATRDLRDLEVRSVVINTGTKGSSSKYELKQKVGS
jgi:ATP-dependent DNA helicase RecG